MRNKIILLIAWTLFMQGIPLRGQEIIFTGKNNSGEKVMVFRNDRVLISADTAYVISAGLMENMEKLKEDYLACLEGREQDLEKVISLLSALEEGYSEVDKLLDESTGINTAQLEEFNRQAGHIIENMKRDIITLEQLEGEIVQASLQLEGLKKEIRKEKRKQRWKIAGVLIAGGLIGFVAGALAVN